MPVQTRIQHVIYIRRLLINIGESIRHCEVIQQNNAMKYY